MLLNIAFLRLQFNLPALFFIKQILEKDITGMVDKSMKIKNVNADILNKPNFLGHPPLHKSKHLHHWAVWCWAELAIVQEYR